MATTGVGGGLSAQQIAQIRRWARGLTAKDSRGLREAGDEIVRLADLIDGLHVRKNGDESWGFDDETEAVDQPSVPVDLSTARDIVSRLGGDPEERAAARALEILCEELESAGAASAAPPPAKPPLGAPTFGGLSPLAFVPTAALLLVAIVVVLVSRAAAPDLSPSGPSSGALIGRSGLGALSFSVGASPQRLKDVRFALDGKDVTSQATRDGDRLVLKARSLPDGEHTVRARLPGLALWSAAGASWHVTVDTQPPTIGLTSDLAEATVRTPFALHVPIADSTAVMVNGKQVQPSDGSITLRGTPPASFTVTARDKSFDVRLGPGERAQLTLKKAGSIPFYCAYHSTMRGVLVVGD